MQIGKNFLGSISKTSLEINNELLYQAIFENTCICKKLHDMLEQNCSQTEYLYDKKKVDLSTTQMTKNFGLSVLSNIVGDMLTRK